MECFAVATPGLEPILGAELEALGIEAPLSQDGGFAFNTSLDKLIDLNLWSRTASRFVIRLARFETRFLNELEELTAKLPWSDFLTGQDPLRIRPTCKRSKIYHTGAVIERVARAIESSLGRSINLAKGEQTHPREQLILVRIVRDRVVISVDSSGTHLHKRGYRQAVAKAPLREHMAAATLLMTGWEANSPFYDPMAGSGTLPIEACLWAINRAPGLMRDFACTQWPSTPKSALLEAKESARSKELSDIPPIMGFDRDPGAISAAQANAERAGVGGLVAFQQLPLSKSVHALPQEPGLLLTNPPYGLRIGDISKLRNLYDSLGQHLTNALSSWDAGIISGNPKLLERLPKAFTSMGPPIFHGGTRVYFHARLHD